MAGILEGKVALITGAGSGIGRAAARIFAREGARLVPADVVEEGRFLCDRIADAGGWRLHGAVVRQSNSLDSELKQEKGK